MKRFYGYIVIVAVQLLGACASSRQVTILDPIGPAPRINAATQDTAGFLKVYSLAGIYNDQGVNYHPHTDYTIYARDGVRVKKVKNAAFPYDEEPTTVSLPAGTYTVEALAEGYAVVRLPVAIETGRLTTVYLEPSNRPAIARADIDAWVRSPTGKAVGWRATVATSYQSASLPR